MALLFLASAPSGGRRLVERKKRGKAWGRCRGQTSETQPHDSHLQRYGGRLRGGSNTVDKDDSETEKQYAAKSQERLIQSVTVFEGILDGSHNLAVFYMLKDEFLLGPVDISLTMGLSMIPWIFKPLWAMLSDRVPIFGRRRTPYLAASFLIIAGSYAGAVLVRSYAGTVGVLLVNTVGRCLLGAVLQGMVVEIARPEVAKDTSEVVGDFFLLKTGGAFASAMGCSMLISAAGPRAVFNIFSALPLVLVLVVARFEALVGSRQLAVATSPPPRSRLVAAHATLLPVPPTKWATLREVVKNPAIWGTLVFLFAYTAGPNYDDSLYYFYINRLHFLPTAVGQLKMAQEAAKLVGMFTYRYWLRNIPDRILLVGLTMASFPLYLTPLLLTTGAYRKLHMNPQMLAISGELVREVFTHLQVMPAFSRWVALCPEGLEGTVVSLLVSTLQVSRAISKVASAGAASAFGITPKRYTNLSALVLFCGGFCLLPLPLAALIPADYETSPQQDDVFCLQPVPQSSERGGPGVLLGSERCSQHASDPHYPRLADDEPIWEEAEPEPSREEIMRAG